MQTASKYGRSRYRLHSNNKIHIYMIIILAVVVFLSGAQLMNPVYGFAIYQIGLS